MVAGTVDWVSDRNRPIGFGYSGRSGWRPGSVRLYSNADFHVPTILPLEELLKIREQRLDELEAFRTAGPLDVFHIHSLSLCFRTW